MRKYILTDPNGLTPKGQKLQPGKFIEAAHQSKDLLSRIGDCCCDDPLVAVLISPLSANPGCRLFQINCWKVGVDPQQAQTYTVVKEIKPVPQVSLEQKISFALLVMMAVYKNKEYAKWAEGWLAGRDRSLETAQAQRRTAEREIQAAEGLETLAAWGEAGGRDAELAARLDHLAHAALHVARAAEHAAHTPPEVGKASLELAQGLARVFQARQAIDLAPLAEKALGGARFVPEQAAGH